MGRMSTHASYSEEFLYCSLMYACPALSHEVEQVYVTVNVDRDAGINSLTTRIYALEASSMAKE